MIPAGLKLLESVLHVKPTLYVYFPPLDPLFYLEKSLLLHSIQIALIKWGEPR